LRCKVANYLMAYDADCGPCTQFKRLVDFLDIYHVIDFVSLADADKLGLLNNMSESLRFKSFHLISPDGDIQSGSEALYDLIALFPLGGHISKLIVLLPGGKRVIRFLYDTFSKLHGTRACHLNYNMRNTEP
jgi:predicted DCC family thiol-disulfide oxidoreductase YuxK